MKRTAILALAIVSLSASADDQTALSKAIDAIKPATNAAGEYVSKSIMQSLSGNDTAMGRAARDNLERQAKAEREANRGTRKTMKECIKPGNVIDEDVQECIMGMRERDW
ncbi:hypothetical protein [Ectopseudomonas composti]|uniref:hypothetical protein n=1 Tax=Ectopseudomonas composti TaxID=658457 RepID=UPI00077383DA|nr:hypothetical protein [Pseudomonas composti]